MSHTKSALITLFCTGLVLAALPGIARASQSNHLTVLKINKPLALPGMVLGPGTYTMKLLFPLSNPDVVGVFNAHDTRLVGTFMGVPDYRAKLRGKPGFQLTEQAKDDPMALKAWFFAGQHSGVQFLYSKSASHRWSNSTTS